LLIMCWWLHCVCHAFVFFFFSSRRRHTRFKCDWSSDVCSSDLIYKPCAVMFLKFNYNITAQGLYIYESPHPGDQTFVNQLNNTLGKTHIQRFEFGDDPIPTLPQIGRASCRERVYIAVMTAFLIC